MSMRAFLFVISSLPHAYDYVEVTDVDTTKFAWGDVALSFSTGRSDRRSDGPLHPGPKGA
jgi:hypothetical protein